MDLSVIAVKVALDSLKITIKRIGSKLSRRKQRQLTSTAIMELLKLDPNMDEVDAALAAAKATGVDPSPDLFRARRMRDKVEKHSKMAKKIMVSKKRSGARKIVLIKKTTRKKAMKKK